MNPIWRQVFLRFLSFLLLAVALPLYGADEIHLRDNLGLARKGDYLVTAQGKMATMLHIFDRSPNTLAIEEISIPMAQLPCSFEGWKQWMKIGAPGNTSWMVYVIELKSGNMQQCYSITKRSWVNISQANNFLTTLLNLPFTLIPDWQKKKAGPPPLLGVPDRRPAWQPRMIVEGKEVAGVLFNAWRAHWPKDGSILSNKTIEVYLPQDNAKYPSYFPYWLQISGVVGKAQIHIIDSGHEMASPALLPAISADEFSREKPISVIFFRRPASTIPAGLSVSVVKKISTDLDFSKRISSAETAALLPKVSA